MVVLSVSLSVAYQIRQVFAETQYMHFCCWSRVRAQLRQLRGEGCLYLDSYKLYAVLFYLMILSILSDTE